MRDSTAFDYAMPPSGRERLRNAAMVGAAALMLGAVGFGVWQLLKDAGAPRKKQVQQISLVQPKELPKPPPEPEKPKEVIKEKIETPPPEPQKTDSPPPEAPLRLEGAAGPGGTLDLGGGGPGKEFNTIPGTPGGTGGVGRGFAFYTSQLQSLLQEELNRKDKLRGAEYSASLALWIGPDGRVQKVELTGSTGNPQTDTLLRETIAASTRLKAPPESMPQPVKLRVTARGTG
ncbi:MAG: TonB C-terminal domain-containing protein [Candidatus Parcubacteria bacterium]|nr:TonB C-terminal domain-containing protein [Burkholderiales bacterium]